MQVELTGAAAGFRPRARAEETLFALLDNTSALAESPRGGGEVDEQIRARREEQTQAHEALLPSRPSDVIESSERNVERGSRSFRRRETQNEARADFRADRAQFRSALRDARAGRAEQGRANAPSPSTPAAEHGKPGDQAKASEGRGQAQPTPAKTAGAEKAAASAPTRENASSDKPIATPPNATAATPTTDRTAPAVVTAVAASASLGVAAAGVAAGRGAPQGANAVTRVGASASTRSVGRVAPPSGAERAAPTGQKPTARTATNPARTQASEARAESARETESANREQQIERILRSVRGQINESRGYAVIRLDPAELGSLRVQLDLRPEGLTVRIDPTQAVAHQMLLEDADRLREALESAGIRTQRIEIRPPAPLDAADQQDAAQSSMQDGSAQTGQDAEAGTAETDQDESSRGGTEATDTGPATGRGEEATRPAAESLVNVIA